MAETDYKTTIKINGDAKGATDAIDRVTKSLLNGGLIGALSKVRQAMASVSRALGTFYLAWNGSQLVINGWKKLTAILTDAQRKAAQAGFAAAFNAAGTAADRLIGKHKEINEQLAKMARSQTLLRELGDIGASAQRDTEASRRDIERASLLAGTTDQRQRQVLQDRFAEEDEKIAAAEAKREREERISALREEAALRRQIVEDQSALRVVIEEELARQREQLDILERWEKPDADRIEATKRRIAGLESERKAAIAAADAAREAETAAGLRAHALEAAGMPAAAAGAVVREGAWRAQDAADRQRYEEFTQKIADNETRGARDRHYATLDDKEKVQELDRRENEARERMAASQKELAEEMSKDVKERDEDRISRTMGEISQAQNEALSAAAQREDLERSISEAENQRRESAAEGLYAQFQGGGNRLTAMGLGSGAEGSPVDEINGKVTSILEVLRRTAESIENLETGGVDTTYGA